MVAALTVYGQGKVTLNDVHRLIDEPVDKSWEPFGEMLPPYGLYLVDVQYLPEDLKYEEELADLTVLENELDKAINSVTNFKGSILEKIELRRKLLTIQSQILAHKQNTPKQC